VVSSALKPKYIIKEMLRWLFCPRRRQKPQIIIFV